MLEAATEISLVEQVQAGDTDAFSALVERHKTAVYAVAFSNTGDRSLSEDVAQEAFLQAWKGRETLQDPARFRAWVCGIARNVARNENRRRSRHPEDGPGHEDHADSAPNPREAAIEHETEQVLWRALREIPDSYREALTLYYREGRSAKQVASALGVTEAAVLQRLKRGRDQLKGELNRIVERELERLEPSPSFTRGVLAALPPAAAVPWAARQGGEVAAAADTAGAAAGKDLWIMQTSGRVAIGAVIVAIGFGVWWTRFRTPAAADSASARAAEIDPGEARSARGAVPSLAVPPTGGEVDGDEVTSEKLRRAGAGRGVAAGRGAAGGDGEGEDQRRWLFTVDGDDDGTLWYKLHNGLPECAREHFIGDAGKTKQALSRRVKLTFLDGNDAARLATVALVEPAGGIAGQDAFEACTAAALRDVLFPIGTQEMSVSFAPGSSRHDDQGVDVELMHSLPVLVGPSRGPDDATVSLVVYTDFQCKYCARALVTIDALLEEYPTQLRSVTKLFPLRPSSRRLAEATVAAALQGKFWGMHGLIFAHMDKASLTDEDLAAFAEQIGLDMDRYREDMAGETVPAIVQADIDEGKALGVRGTPTAFVNDNRVMGAQPIEKFREQIDQELAK